MSGSTLEGWGKLLVIGGAVLFAAGFLMSKVG